MAVFIDIASDAHAEIGQLGIGQTLNAEQSNLSIRLANRIIGKWSTKRLLLFHIDTFAFTLTPTVRDYAIGPVPAPGVLFQQDRPVFIESALGFVFGTTVRIPMTILNKSQWESIIDVDSSCSASAPPDKIWPDYAFPNLLFHVHPVPASPIVIHVGAWSALAQIATIQDVINFPPGYEEALTQALAFELAPFYDMPITDALTQLATDSLLAIEGLNAQTLRGFPSEAQRLISPNVGQPAPTGGPPQGAPSQ